MPTHPNTYPFNAKLLFNDFNRTVHGVRAENYRRMQLETMIHEGSFTAQAGYRSCTIENFLHEVNQIGDSHGTNEGADVSFACRDRLAPESDMISTYTSEGKFPFQVDEFAEEPGSIRILSVKTQLSSFTIDRGLHGDSEYGLIRVHSQAEDPAFRATFSFLARAAMEVEPEKSNQLGEFILRLRAANLQ